ncbi:tudor domain-containing 6 [Bemisia tabaci]|uniref:tudor domain-containing 6 n=1 Tax=Bemisia tabaci TaxID=7038 RepID=UPI003B2849E2
MSKESGVKKFQARAIKDLLAIEKEATERFACINGILQVAENNFFNKLREERNNLMNAYVQLEEELAASKNSIEAILTEAKEAVAKKGVSVNVFELNKALDEIATTVPSNVCWDSSEAPSEETTYRLEKLTDKQVSETFKEAFEGCFKLSCPALPKVKLVSDKHVSDHIRVEELIQNSESVSSLSKQYGIPTGAKEDDTLSQHSSLGSDSLGSLANVESTTENATSGRSSPILPTTLATLAPGSAEMVTVAHIVSPSEFYINRKGVSDILQQNKERYRRYVMTTNPEVPASLNKSGLYLVTFEKDTKDQSGDWYRGLVLKTDIPDKPGKVFVLYIDYGTTAYVDISCFRIMPHDQVKSQHMQSAARCQNVIHVKEHGEVMMHVMEVTEKGLEVDLVRVHEINHVSVRDALIFLELASFLPSSEKKQEVPKTLLIPKSKFAKGDIVEGHISHVVSPSEFYCVELDTHYRQLHELMAEMTELYSDPARQPGNILNPVVGMSVAAKYSEDEKWYRAVITNLPGKRLVDVFYVDFGNRERVTYLDVRALLPKFLRMSTQAIHCSLCDIKPPKKSDQWPEKAGKLLQQLEYTLARLVIQDIKVVDNQPKVSVVLFTMKPDADICINAYLVQEGVAVSTGVNSTVVTFHRVQNSKKLTALQGLCTERDQEKLNDAPSDVAAKLTKKTKKKTTEKKKKEGEEATFTEGTDISCAASVTSSSTALTEESEDGDQTHRIEVKVISAASPSQIYVRLHNQEVDKFIEELNWELDKFYATSSPDPSAKWKEGDICVAFNPEDKHWYRSIVREVFDDHFLVVMKDIGKDCQVKKEHLRPIKEKFLKGFIDGTIRCHLAGVLAAGGGKWASYAIERVQEELNKHSSVFITKRGQIDTERKSLPIELWVKRVTYGGALEPDIEEWVSMNMFVVQQGLAIPDRTFQKYIAPAEDLLHDLKQMQHESSSNINSRSYVVSWLQDQDGQSGTSSMELKTMQVKKKKKNASASAQEISMDWKPPAPLDDLELDIIPTFVDENNLIYFHELSREDTLKQIEQALLVQYKNSKPQPQDMFWYAGQLCIAQYHSNGLWYRGKIIKVTSDSTYQVQFVDYGNVEDVKASELRKRVFLTEVPTFCHVLALHNVRAVSEDGRWQTNVLDFVHANVVEKVCRVKLQYPEKDGAPFLALSFAPPGGIELVDILVGLGYAIRGGASEEESSTISEDSDDDVVVVSSQNKESDEENEAGLEDLLSPPSESIDNIVASIMKPREIDLRSLSRSSKSDGASNKSRNSLVDFTSPPPDSRILDIPRDPSVVSELSIESVIAESSIFAESLSLSVLDMREQPKEELEVTCLLSHKSFNEVRITCVVDIDTFYGQLAALDEVVESVFKDMQTYVPEAPSLSKLKVDTLCAVLMDEEWHRARILTLSPAITAQLVDLGDIIVVKEDQLREIPAILQSERIHCFKFKISNASKEHAKLKISDIVRIKPEMFCPESDSWIVVVEDNHRAQDSVIKSEQTGEKEIVNEFGAFLDLPILPTMEEVGVEVTAIAGLTDFFVQIKKTTEQSLLEILNEYEAMFEEIQKEAPSGRPLLEPLRIGQECCALYEDDNWYRAVIVAKFPENEEMVMVRFIDFGNKQPTPTKNLRPVKRKWMDIPRQCISVRLADMKKADGVTGEALKEAFELLQKIIFCPLKAVIKELSNPMLVLLFKDGTEEPVCQPLIDAGFFQKVD